MEQHPIPQNISSYEFRLVGDMTLKQFLQLAAGIVLAIIIYRLPLINIIKYPLVFMAIVLGITLAFVPINGRPFARYIWAFLLAIYSPTQYHWRHEDVVTPTAVSPLAPNPPTVVSPVEPSHPVASTPPLVNSTSTDTAESATPTPNQTGYSTLSSNQLQPDTKTSTPSTPNFPHTSAPVTEERPAPSGEIYSSQVPVETQSQILPPVDSQPRQAPSSTSATYTDLIIKPEHPNIFTGLVVTTDGNPIENAIIEILDASSGIPARALRTNRLGQFQIATPLANGNYIVQTEKTSLEFTPINIQASGLIIEPVIINPVA